MATTVTRIWEESERDVVTSSRKVEEATKKRDALVQRRDEAIRKWHRRGASLREIAAVSGVSHSGVAIIVRKK